jgi:hypothetical protein
MSNNSDDELEENNHIEKIFLNSEIELSNCYVCYIDTNYISPCYCKTHVCSSCFINILRNNGEICTICKVKFNEEILENIKDEYEEFRNIESLEIDISTEDDEDEQNFWISRDDNYNVCYKAGLFILSIPFIGLFISTILGFKSTSLVSFLNILLGILTYFFLLFLYFLFYLIYHIFYFIFEKITKYIHHIYYESL